MISKCLKNIYKPISIHNKLIANISIKESGLMRPLSESDPDVHNLIEDEKKRLKGGLQLIASENLSSKGVSEALGSIFQMKYSEGYPGQRYYSGTEQIDKLELMCMERALDAFKCNNGKWGVNVQSLSGSPANFQVYNAVMNPHDRIMSLDLPHGGHLSHGYKTAAGKSISAVSNFYEVFAYKLSQKTQQIDYDELAELAVRYRPKVLIAGASAYARIIDYKRMREIADSCGAYLLADVSHISGLICTELIPTPFDYADIITTTTHKTLRGPRHALIFYREGVRSVDKKGVETKYDLKQKINDSVFPGLQGGPHNHSIAALTVALKEANQPLFVTYQKQVLANAKAMADTLLSKGIQLVTGGTDNHLCLMDLTDKDIDGGRVEMVLEALCIYTNKNTVPTDTSALVPKGIRIGAPVMTTRGCVEKDFVKIAEFLVRGVDLTKEIRKDVKSKKQADFKKHLAEKKETYANYVTLKKEISDFNDQFEICF